MTQRQSVLPFVSQENPKSEALWLEAFRTAFQAQNHTTEIISFSELSESQKQEIEVAIVANPRISDLEQLPNLKWVQSTWAGVESLARDSDKSLHIVRMVDQQLGDTMAEAVLAWTLYLHRDMPTYARQQAEQLWVEQPLIHARDRRIGILGLGALGEKAAERLSANGFSVRGWSRNGKACRGVEKVLSGEDGLRELLGQSDILVVLLPLTPETRGLLNNARLAQLPEGASLINFGRGPLLVEEDLLHQLDHGPLRHAVLDVFETEPLPASNPLWTHPGVTILPHITAPTDKPTASTAVARNIIHYWNSGELPEGVDRGAGY
ncbi:2-hydroxyacid dehydrogenase [Kiloniella sp. b19]|uniref:2-hydroxyacid dehydrogenase n=1 Tax=Kiloniella sp. GXU_MW_B19 TaxID=3141326 RepID=UPI0031DA1B77